MNNPGITRVEKGENQQFRWLLNHIETGMMCIQVPSSVARIETGHINITLLFQLVQIRSKTYIYIYPELLPTLW